MKASVIDKIIIWLKYIRGRFRYRKEYLKLILDGKLLPPPHYAKQKAVRDYGRRFSLDTLVESGTYLGEMVDAQRKYFKRIISIELSQSLYESARNKFITYKHINIYQGDSGKLIKEIVANLNMPALFWLDGHYSGGNTAKADVETPILSELDAILKTNENHVILIDDARSFLGTNDYPTIEYARKFVIERKGNYILKVKDDIIRLTKGSE
jgi:hypothetical protein